MDSLQKNILKEKLELRDSLQKDIIHSYRFIESAKEKIRKLESYIYDNCNHEWEYFDDGDPYSKLRYVCKHCKLYRNSYMYSLR